MWNKLHYHKYSKNNDDLKFISPVFREPVGGSLAEAGLVRGSVRDQLPSGVLQGLLSISMVLPRT